MKKYLSLALCVFVLTATANTAQAFDKKDLAKLKKTNQCIGCKLIEADLYKAVLYNANLSGANLRGANLSFANLDRADLTDANLVQARLSGAKLIAARLSGANLRGANLSFANLDQADLRSADLSGARLSRALLHRVDLSGAKLSFANLTEANLDVADLRGADLSRANLTGADLDRVDLRSADLSGARLSRARLSGANLTDATWTDGIKCGKGSIGGCVRDKKSTADKKAKPHDIPVKTASSGNVKWAASSGRLPANAFIGGSEGSRKLAVCRAAYQGGTHPGKVVAGKCNIGWGGKEIVIRKFEVMTNKGVKLAWAKGPSAKGMIIGGAERGRSLPVCRGKYKSGTHPGKVVAGKCNIGWGGKEIVLRSFEVLVQR